LAPFKYRKNPLESPNPASSLEKTDLKAPVSYKSRPSNHQRLYESTSTVLSQAGRIFLKFGGVPVLLRALKAIGRPRSKTSLYRWDYPRAEGGTGGLIPTSAWPDIARAARLEGIHLTPEDLDPRHTARTKKNLVGFVSDDGQVTPFIHSRDVKKAWYQNRQEERRRLTAEKNKQKKDEEDKDGKAS
jgi:hypothetical protein